MTKKDVPVIYTMLCYSWIADKMPIGTTWKVVQQQSLKNKCQITFMAVDVGRPKKE